MLRRLLIALCMLGCCAVAQAAQPDSAEAARAMLERAVAALQADEAKALEMFNASDGGFRDGDLYVFCAGAADGIETAHPTHKGRNLRDIKDSNGFAFGEQIMDRAMEGKVSEITYVWPRPGGDTPVEKVTLFTKVGGQICAVGYYK